MGKIDLSEQVGSDYGEIIQNSLAIRILTFRFYIRAAIRPPMPTRSAANAVQPLCTHCVGACGACRTASLGSFGGRYIEHRVCDGKSLSGTRQQYGGVLDDDLTLPYSPRLRSSFAPLRQRKRLQWQVSAMRNMYDKAIRRREKLSRLRVPIAKKLSALEASPTRRSATAVAAADHISYDERHHYIGGR